QAAELHKLTEVALVLPMLMAAPESRLRAPTVVVKLLAALPVRRTAPRVTDIPAPPVIEPLKVLSPPKVWVPLVTTPARLAEALDTLTCRVSGFGPVFRV